MASKAPIVYTREVLIEKTGHKTETERKEWVRQNHIHVYYPNSASGSMSFIGGGTSSTAIGHSSVIAIGNYTTLSTNTAMGYASFVGGITHTASGNYSAITGGHNNTAVGYSVITGGYCNTASRTITQEEYKRIGRVGTKKWGFAF